MFWSRPQHLVRYLNLWGVILIMDEDKIVLDRRSFEALAVDSRVRIMKSLTQRRKTLSELSSELNLSVSAVKEHLENLEGAGLIVKMDDGHKWKYYELTKKGKDIIGPKELKVWILLSISLVALMVSVMFLNAPILGSPNTSSLATPAVQPQTFETTVAGSELTRSSATPQNDQIMKIVTAPDLATPPQPPETEDANYSNETNISAAALNQVNAFPEGIVAQDSGSQSPIWDFERVIIDSTPICLVLVAGISALTIIGCIAILIRNRMRNRFD